MRKLLLGIALVMTLAGGTSYGLAETGQKEDETAAVCASPVASPVGEAATPATYVPATPGVSAEEAGSAHEAMCATPEATPGS